MKKFLLTLALTACVFGMTACSEQETEAFPFTQDQVVASTESILAAVDDAVNNGIVELYMEEYEAQYDEDAAKAFNKACANWETSLEEIGTYQGIDKESVVVEGTIEEFKVVVDVKGSERGATVELFYTEDALVVPDMMISPYYTLSEKMTKAALNTLLGMGTVFIVLILIMAIIYAFGLIPKIEKALADNKAKKQTKTEDAVDNTIAQIIEKEELSDDTELVAVIAAAIAASEGAASTDGFVVRSIKRASTNKWQRA